MNEIIIDFDSVKVVAIYRKSLNDTRILLKDCTGAISEISYLCHDDDHNELCKRYLDWLKNH
jgi:5-bromo-4-chloroindolyl phosphate hydrolysis protein